MADNLNFSWGNVLSTASPGASAGTGASLTTSAATSCVINGKFCTALAPQTNAALPVVDAASGQAFNSLKAGQTCSVVFGTNSAGQLQVCQGRAIDCAPGGTLLIDPQFPGMPNDFCPFAYTIVRTATGAAAWTPGVSAWAATGVVSSTFQNCCQLPNRPQAA